MAIGLTHVIGESVRVTHGRSKLVEYTYRPHGPAAEGLKPYLHPVRTLSGHVVTAARPHDHAWHKGITFSFSHVNDQNFWGGPTYLRDRGYVQLDNCGSIEHASWRQLDHAPGSAILAHDLVWRAFGGERLIDEQRAVSITDVDVEERRYAIDFATTIRCAATEPLRIGSPTTNGRPDAGYGALAWRGPRSFTGGRVMAAGGLEGEDAVMGRRGPWAACSARHDEVDAESTLIFIDDPANPRHPTKWFARSTPFPLVTFALTYDEELTLAPGEALSVAYRIVVADGAWDPGQVQAYVDEHAGATPLSITLP